MAVGNEHTASDSGPPGARAAIHAAFNQAPPLSACNAGDRRSENTARTMGQVTRAHTAIQALRHSP